jgi:hypothetical protein
VTPEDVLWWIGGVEMPKAEVAKTREAAAVWGRLAGRLESSIETTDPMAADIYTKNSGAAIDGFKDFWTKDFKPYPHEVAAYCRRMQTACDGYADAIEETKFALTLLAIQTYANILLTISWGWITGWAGTLAELAVIRDRAAVQAAVQRTLLQKILIKLLEYLIDGVGYAMGQQLLQLGIFGVGDLFGNYDARTKKVIGFDPYSLKANGRQFGEAVGANTAFNGGSDLTSAGLKRAGPLGRFLSAGSAGDWRERALGVGSRMVGSNLYTVMNNVEDGKPPDRWLPTVRQEVDKLIIHGTRFTKNPAHGPIGSGHGGP